MWTAKQRQRWEWETWARECEDAREDEKRGTGNKNKAEGADPRHHHWHGMREGDVAGCRDDANKHSGGGRGDGDVGIFTVSPSAPTTTPIWVPGSHASWQPPKKCPPHLSSLQKDNLQLSYGEDPEEIRYSRDAGLEVQHIFVKELKKRKKKPIDVLCSRELTGYVCVTEGVIMLLYLLSLI